MVKLRWTETTFDPYIHWVATPYYDDPDDESTMWAVRIRKRLSSDVIIMVWKDGTVHISANGLIALKPDDLLMLNKSIQEAFTRMNPITAKR